MIVSSGTRFLKQCQERMDTLLLQHFPDPSNQLLQAMCYSCQNGGKRLRPFLVYATGALFEVDPQQLDRLALALELIHTYSLVHDDLPAMDNDDFRRGQPSCHKAFDEATAILAGDALLTSAFELLALPWHPQPQTQLRIIQLIAECIGPKGMVQGQALDCASQGQVITLDQLQHIHENKTGKLMSACVQSAAIACNANTAQLTALTQFAQAFGLTFQIQDDILDVVGSMEQTGKISQQDAKLQKNTFVTFFDLKTATQKAHDYANQAIQALDCFGENAASLIEMIKTLLYRVSACVY